MRSLAHLKFTAAMDRESQVYWRTVCAFAYGTRGWRSIEENTWPLVLAGHQGDSGMPFRRVGVSPRQYISEAGDVIEAVRENTIVAFSSAFETFLSDVLARAVFIDPTIAKDSALQFSAADVARGVGQESVHDWFAKAFASRYVWNRAHDKVITDLNTMLRLGLRLPSSDVDEWRLWQLVRNSVIHCARTVSAQLASAWPERFHAPHVGLALNDEDVTSVSALARRLVAAMDTRFASSIVRERDAELLVREIFVRWGIGAESSLSFEVYRLIRYRLPKERIRELIAEQRRSPRKVVGFDFSGLFDAHGIVKTLQIDKTFLSSRLLRF